MSNISSSRTVSNQLLRNALVSIAGLGTALLISVFLTPMTIHYLGNVQYGVWVLIGSFMGYFGFLDLGLSKATMRYVSQALGSQDHASVGKWISVSLFCFIVVSVVGILASYLIWRYYTYTYLTSETEVIALSLLVSSITFAITLPSRCYVGVLEAYIRRDIIGGIELTTSIFRGFLVVLIFVLHGRLFALVCLSACILLIQSNTYTVIGLRLSLQCYRQKDRFTRRDVKRFSEYALASFTSEIADIVRFRTAPVIVAYFLGMTSVTMYSIADQLSNMAGNIANKLLLNLTPAFSQIEGMPGKDRYKRLRETYLFSLKIANYFGAYLCGMVMMIAHPLVTRWVGSAFSYSSDILVIMMIGVYCAVIQIPTVCLLFAVSRHKYYAWTNGIQALLFITLSIVMVHFYGLMGVAISVAVSGFIVKLMIQPLCAMKILDISYGEYYLRNCARYSIISGLYLGSVYMLSRMWLLPNYLSIATLVLVSTIGYVVYIGFLGLTSDERAYIMRAFRKPNI